MGSDIHSYTLIILKPLIMSTSKAHKTKTWNSPKNMTLSNIVLVKAESNYSFIYLNDGSKIFTSRTLKHWQNFFNDQSLVRIHRSYLINLSFVELIDKKSKGITLSNGIELACARSFSRIGLADLLDEFANIKMDYRDISISSNASNIE